MKILVTGTAGFIGYHLAERLFARGDEIVGLDSINDYYDVGLKNARLRSHGIDPNKVEYGKLVPSTRFGQYKFIKLKVEDREGLKRVFLEGHFDRVCHLAAQAGVRYSLSNPSAYIDSNIVGFANLLECCREYQIAHLVYASSSSVYGLNESMPFSTSDSVDHPVSLYAASKKSNELMAHVYSHLFALPTTGLRFFTVYGPWGRPDMALFLFTRAILEGKVIDVFNNGNMKRDFTYVDDIVEGVVRVLDSTPRSNGVWSGKNPDPASSKAPYRIYNIGAGAPVQLLKFIEELEKALGKKAVKKFLPIQDGDVPETWADVTSLEKDFGYKPHTSVKEGIARFVDWYREFYAQ